jgi:hypothetical protein
LVVKKHRCRHWKHLGLAEVNKRLELGIRIRGEEFKTTKTYHRLMEEQMKLNTLENSWKIPRTFQPTEGAEGGLLGGSFQPTEVSKRCPIPVQLSPMFSDSNKLPQKGAEWVEEG